MRRLLLVLGLALAGLWSTPAGAAVSFVQAKAAAAANSNTVTVTVTPTSTTTVNNTVVVAIHYSKCAGCAVPHTVSGVADTGGSTYSLQAGPVQAAGSNQVTETWATAAGAAHASTSIVASIAGTTASVFLSADIGEYSGVVTFGNTNTATATGTTASVSVTSQNAANWIVGGAYNDSCGATFTAVSGTIRVTDTGGACAVSSDTVLMDVGPASGSQTLSWTDASSPWEFAAVELCAQTPCSGSGGVTPTRTLMGVGQ